MIFAVLFGKNAVPELRYLAAPTRSEFGGDSANTLKCALGLIR